MYLWQPWGQDGIAKKLGYSAMTPSAKSVISFLVFWEVYENTAYDSSQDLAMPVSQFK